MAITAAELNVRLSTTGADQVKRDMNDVGKAVDQTGQNSRMMGGALLGMGTAIAGAFAYGVTEAISFGEQMANVNSIAQLTSSELAALSDQVLSLSSTTGQSAETLASGLYDIQSSGFAGADAMLVLEASAAAANAGLTTTATSAKGITAVLNAYNLTAADAAHVSDVMFQTVNDGVITFEQLSANMGNTLPMANALGVSFEELAAGYAQMTLSGVPASQVETQIASLMRSALNPTEALTTAVQNHGYATVESLIAAEGFTGYLDVLTEASGGSTEALYDLLGTQEAVNAALLLGGENAAAYEAEVAKMEASSVGLGATQTALAKQMESTAFSLRLLKTNVQAAAIALGTQLEPGIRFVANAMTAGIKAFLRISKPMQQVIGIVTAMVGVLALAAGAWVLFGTQIAAAAGLFLSLLGPIALIAAAVAGLYLAWQTNFLGIRDIVSDVVSGVTNFFSTFSDSFRNLTEDIKEFNLWGGEIGTTIEGMAVVPAFFLALGNALAQVGGGVPILEDLGRAMMALPAVIQGAITEFQRLGDIFREDGLGTALGALAVDLAGVVVNIGSWTKGTIADLWPYVTQWATEAMGAVAGAAGTIWNVIVNIGSWAKGIVSDLWPYVSMWATEAMSGIASAAGTIWNVIVNIGSWAKGVVSDIWPYVTMWASEAMGAVASAAGTIWGVIVNIGSWAKGIVSDIWPYITQWASDAMASATGAAGTLWGVIVNIGSWAAGEIASLGDWLAIQIGLQDFTPVGSMVGAKVMSAISLAFSAGEAVGGATGGVFNIGASILNWINRQIESQLGGGFEAVGQRIGQALAAATASFLSDGTALTPIGSAFSHGLITAIGSEMGESGFTDSFWRLFDNIGEAGGEVFEGIAEGFLQSFADAIAPGGLLTLPGGFTISIPDIDFGGALASNFKAAFLEAVMPTSTLELGTVAASIDDIDLGDLQAAFLEAFLNAAVPGGSIVIPALDVDIGGLNPFGGDSGTSTEERARSAIANLPPSSGDFGQTHQLQTPRPPDAEGWIQWQADVSAAIDGVVAKSSEAQAAIAGIFGGGGGGRGAGGGGGADASGLIGSLTAVQTALQGLTTLAGVASAAMNGVIVAIANGITTASAVLTASVTGMSATMTAAMASMAAATAAGMNGVIVSIANGMTTARSVLTASVAGMAAAMTTGMAMVRGAVASAMASVIVAVANGMATARAVTAAGAAGMAASMVAGMAAFRNAVTSGIAAAVGAVRSGVAQMVAVAAAGAGAMRGAGQAMGAALGQGVAAGIQSQIGAVAAAAAALVSAAVGAARAAGAISSPSKVMQEQVGQMLGLGAALGIEDMYPRVATAAAGLIQTPTVPYSAGNGLRQSAGSGGGDVTITMIVQGSVNGVDDLDARFRDFAEGIKGHLTQHRTAVLGGAS